MACQIEKRRDDFHSLREGKADQFGSETEPGESVT
jgi:hypothetical protein